MNIDILNYDYYRLTSHGGRTFDLFNRKSDKVLKISREEFDYIKKTGFHAAVDVEGWNKKKTKE